MSKVSNVPQIRFKGFTDAWEQRRLEEIFLKIRNAFVGTSTPYYVEKNQGGHFYIESNNVKHGKINHDTEVFINEEFYQNQKDKWLKTGDIVMVQSGHVGHSAVIPEYLNNSAAHALIMFQEYQIETNPNFINFQFQTESVRNKIDSITTGNTIKHILASEMKLFSISNTQKKEADQIGNFFISLDNLITLHQRKYNQVVNLKKAMLEKMFPKDGCEIPVIRFKNFSGEKADAWQEKSLLEESDVIGTGKSKFNLNESGPYEILGSTSVIGYDDNYDYEGDFILIARVGANAGELYRFSGKVKISDNTVFIQGNKINFIYYLLVKSNLKRLSFGTGQPLVKASELKDKVILVPQNVEEREQIGVFFEKLDKVISLYHHKLQKLNNLKKALLEKMFV